MDCQMPATETDAFRHTRFEFPDSLNYHHFAPVSSGSHLFHHSCVWTQSVMSTQMISFSFSRVPSLSCEFQEY